MITNYTVVLDRLELMLIQQPNNNLNLHSITLENARESYELGSVTLYKVETEGHYQLRYEVVYNGLEIGFIRLLPTSPTAFYAGKPMLAFKVAKRLLYSVWLPDLNIVLDALSLSLNNISSYEIALDTNADAIAMLLDNFFDHAKWFIVRNQITNNIQKVSTLYRTGQEDATFYVGKRSYSQVAFYNKSLKGHTGFIKQFHKNNGLDISQNIYRIEVRESRKAMVKSRSVYVDNLDASITEYQYNKLDHLTQRHFTKSTKHTKVEPALSDLTDPAKLLSLFKRTFTRLVDFRLKDKAKKEKCTRISLIDFQHVNTYKANETTSPSMKQDTNYQKRLIKNCLENYKIAKRLEDWERALSVSLAYELMEYFNQQLIKLRVKQPVSAASKSVDCFA
ncbi:hypothetical protein D3Y59_11265 [Hymenobacter oligotrophus]|uniref:Replication initiation protein n=1 Tax=Hymenobacter oligotrophus TaxID=2319843 RepID=A0A3B7REA9_9BACT|nr:hypothetical protein [Hymenobacter oligotrophus]AYA37576.1 hypothetical protein D3Y59_11265 [Hymenobacter oligotrophus]